MIRRPGTLVERHSSLVWSICRRYRLSQADAEDVFQTAWVRLVEQLDRLCDPVALCGWLTELNSQVGYAGPSDRGVRRPGAGNERAINLVLAQAQRCADGQKVYCITCSQDAVFPG